MGMVSVVDVAGVSEKPGVPTPSRKLEFEEGLHDDNGTKEEKENVNEETQEKTSPTKRHPPPPVRSRRHAPPPVPPMIQVNGGKKLPPKAPPGRRTKLKSMSSSGNLEHQAQD